MESRLSKTLSKLNEEFIFDAVNRVVKSKETLAGQPKFIVEEQPTGINYYLNVKVDAESDPLYGLLMENAGCRWSRLDDFEGNAVHPEFTKLRLIATVGCGKVRSVFDFVREEPFRLTGVEMIVDELVVKSPTPSFISGIASVLGNNIVHNFILSIVYQPSSYDELRTLILDNSLEIPSNWKQFSSLIAEARSDSSTFDRYITENVLPIAQSLAESAVMRDKEIIFTYDKRRFSIIFNFETKRELIIIKNYTRMNVELLKKAFYVFLKSQPSKKPIVYNFITNKRYEFSFNDIMLDQEISLHAVSIVGKEVYYERKWQTLHYEKETDEFYILVNDKAGNQLAKAVPKREVKEIVDKHKYRD